MRPGALNAIGTAGGESRESSVFAVHIAVMLADRSSRVESVGSGSVCPECVCVCVADLRACAKESINCIIMSRERAFVAGDPLEHVYISYIVVEMPTDRTHTSLIVSETLN